MHSMVVLYCKPGVCNFSSVAPSFQPTPSQPSGLLVVSIFCSTTSIAKGRRQSAAQKHRNSAVLGNKLGSMLEASVMMGTAAHNGFSEPDHDDFMDGPMQQAIQELTKLAAGNTQLTDAVLNLQQVCGNSTFSWLQLPSCRQPESQCRHGGCAIWLPLALAVLCALVQFSSLPSVAVHGAVSSCFR